VDAHGRSSWPAGVTNGCTYVACMLDAPYCCVPYAPYSMAIKKPKTPHTRMTGTQWYIPYVNRGEPVGGTTAPKTERLRSHMQIWPANLRRIWDDQAHIHNCHYMTHMESLNPNVRGANRIRYPSSSSRKRCELIVTV
jgi:hypothetical protein